MNVIDWLLADDTPGVQMLARRDLLDEDPESRRMRSLRRRTNDYPPVARMLDRLDEAIAAGAYRKYQGAYWTLLFLSEMQADGRDPRVRRLAEHVLAARLSTGGFAPVYKRAFDERWEIVCLSANMLRALSRLGYGEHEAVVRGYRRLAERILPHGGVPCRIIDEHSLLSSCKMTLPQTLRALAAAPPGVPRDELARLREVLVGQLLEVRIYRYVRPDGRRFFKELVPLRPKGTTVRAYKAAYLEGNPVGPEDLVEKKGWLRFGFPHSYNSDLLEAMLALAELGVAHRPALDEALDQIERKRGADGRWRLDHSLNGKMLADVERKGRPSKWITLSALTVLRHFGRLDGVAS